jgi:hypothetical protein
METKNVGIAKKRGVTIGLFVGILFTALALRVP